MSLKFIGVALQLRSDCVPVETNAAAQGSWEQIATSFKDCFYYTLEPMCQSIEVIMTEGLLIELNEPSKQIKIMKHFVLPNRQTAVPPESYSAGRPGWGVRGEGRVCLKIARGSTNTAFQQLARGCSEHSETLPSYLGFSFKLDLPGPGPLFLPLVFKIASLPRFYGMKLLLGFAFG